MAYDDYNWILVDEGGKPVPTGLVINTRYSFPCIDCGKEAIRKTHRSKRSGKIRCPECFRIAQRAYLRHYYLNYRRFGDSKSSEKARLSQTSRQ